MQDGATVHSAYDLSGRFASPWMTYVIFKNKRFMVPRKSHFGFNPMKFKLLFTPSLSFIERKTK